MTAAILFNHESVLALALTSINSCRVFDSVRGAAGESRTLHLPGELDICSTCYLFRLIKHPRTLERDFDDPLATL